MSMGHLFVISAPSGTGKTTVLRAVHTASPSLAFSVSFTTRPSRAGEVDGRDYHFVTDAEFERMIASGGLLEWAHVHGAKYGTGQEALEAQRALGDVVLDVDIQGGRAIKQYDPTATLIFLMPPSREVLAQRLRGRGTESPEALARRLQKADQEMAAREDYDFVVTNDHVADACKAILQVMKKS